jgi:hypothetical protein
VFSKSLEIGANTPLLNPITHCHFCRSDFRDIKPNQHERIVSQEEIEYQRLLIKAVEEGWIEVPPTGPMYSHLYFVVLHKLMRMLSQRRRGDSLQVSLGQSAGIQISDIIYRSKTIEMEYLSISERRTLLSMVRWLVNDWPERFIAFCKDHKVLSWQLFYTLEPIPFWYWSVVHSHLTKEQYEVSAQEVESAITWMRKNSSPIMPHKYSGERKAVSEFLTKVTTYRRRKLWKIFGSRDPRDKSHRMNVDAKVTTGRHIRVTSSPKPRYVPDTLWEDIKPLLPYIGRKKHSPDDRTVLNGTLYVLSKNCTWDTIPSEFGTWKQVYNRYQKWKRLGDFDYIWSLCKHLYS